MQSAGMLSHLQQFHQEEHDQLKSNQEAAKRPKQQPVKSGSVQNWMNKYSIEELSTRLIVNGTPIRQLVTDTYQAMLTKCYGSELVPTDQRAFKKVFELLRSIIVCKSSNISLVSGHC